MGEARKINILGLEYDIVFISPVARDEWLAGRIDFHEQVIYIDSEIKDDRKRITLLHEVIHGILSGLGFHSENQNEEMIQGLATGLHHFLKHSVDLVT